MSGFYDIAVNKIDGGADLLGGLRGKVTLAVNVASRCGLTPQYEGLEQLQRELAGQNFTRGGLSLQPVRGPGTWQRARRSSNFCRTTYGVSFPLSEKLDVNGRARSPVYAVPRPPRASGVGGDITWNFEKFLIGRDGRVLHRYPPRHHTAGPRPMRTSPRRCEPAAPCLSRHVPEFEFAVPGAGAMGSIVGATSRAPGTRSPCSRAGRAPRSWSATGITVRGLAEFTHPGASRVRDPRSFAGAATLIVATKTPGTARVAGGRCATPASASRSRSRTAR